MKYYLAVDIGASGGRHIIGYMKDGELMTDEVYRFPNGMDERDGHLVWDRERLVLEVTEGLRRAFARYPEIESMSIDTWGVDYVLMRGDKEVEPMYAYRDGRTEEPIKLVHDIIPFPALYERTGIQFNSFNTIYQLYADKLAGRLDGVTAFLMLPEYLMYKLTGVMRHEYTNATTTGLVNAKTHEFDPEIWSALGLPEGLMAKLSAPGTLVGRLLPDVQAHVGGNLNVVLCATHDTGSAVEAIDMEINAPYISSGTWSLLGIRTPEALTDENSRENMYSNEGGVGYNRYQKNITGMWINQSLRRELCPETGYGELVTLAYKSKYEGIIDVNDPSFSAPRSMKEAMDVYLVSHGYKKPKKTEDYFRCAYESLAEGYRIALDALCKNTGIDFCDVYIVGGGAKNGYVNEATERRTGKRVHAMPIEATAIGNLKVQMKADK